MLEPRHIVRLQLNSQRLKAHQEMPLPRYVTKPLIGQFTTISDAILTSLLNIDIEVFRKQLVSARGYGAEYLGIDTQNKPIGITATTSLVKTGSIMTKSLIVPQDFLKFDRRLTDHFVIGAFIHGEVDKLSGKLITHGDEVEVAGWATVADIQQLQASQPPPTFKTKLQVIMVPCTSLRPIETLLERIDINTLSI